jgi:hypothetical protein
VTLGELKGQVTTLINLVGQKREDINALYGRVGLLEQLSASRQELGDAEKRINSLEKEIAKWAGICLAASLALPLVMPYLTEGVQRIERTTHQKQP